MLGTCLYFGTSLVLHMLSLIRAIALAGLLHLDSGRSPGIPMNAASIRRYLGLPAIVEQMANVTCAFPYTLCMLNASSFHYALGGMHIASIQMLITSLIVGGNCAAENSIRLFLRFPSPFSMISSSSFFRSSVVLWDLTRVFSAFDLAR